MLPSDGALKPHLLIVSGLVHVVMWLWSQPIYEVIAKDPDIEKIQRQITGGVTINGQNLTNYLMTWDNYREIWEINKDAFIRRYQKLNPQVSSFDADIARSVPRCRIIIIFFLILGRYDPEGI